MARQKFNLSLPDSYLISDRYKDIQFAHNNNVKSIMVKTGYGLGELTYQKKTWTINPDYICENLLDAAYLIQKIETSISN